MITDHFTSSLSDDQKIAVSKVESFLASPTNCFLLKGYAGTGKTFLMQGLVKYFKSVGRQFTLMAPTGRAAMVIGDKTKTDAYTVHKSIYNLSELEDDDHTFKFRYKLNLNENSLNTVYIIDESSMISDVYNEDEFFLFGSGYLLKDLFSFVDFKYRTDAKIIFIGDHAQLPPVGMSFSPALDKRDIEHKGHLYVFLNIVAADIVEFKVSVQETLNLNTIEYAKTFSEFSHRSNEIVTKILDIKVVGSPVKLM